MYQMNDGQGDAKLKEEEEKNIINEQIKQV